MVLGKTINSVFRENMLPSPHLPRPPYGEFSVFLLLWPWKLGQGHQNLISSLLCPNYISMQIWQESNHWFTRYCADKKVWCQPQCQRDPHQKQYVPLTWGGGHNYLLCMSEQQWSRLACTGIAQGKQGYPHNIIFSYFSTKHMLWVFITHRDASNKYQ